MTKLVVCCQAQVYCNGHNHTQIFVMVIITFKTIWKSRLSFLWSFPIIMDTTKSGSIYKIWK